MNSGLLPPPKSLVESDSTVIVSAQRPVVVYFKKAKGILFSKLLNPQADGGPVVEIKLVGAGGAIPRCEQVARYLVQEVKSKCKALIKSVEKSVSKGSVSAQEFHLGEFDNEEEQALNMTVTDKQVSTVSISIRIVRN